MAFVALTKSNYAFKTILGKTHTSNSREAANEAISSGITLGANRIFAQNINPVPTDSSNSGIVSAELTLELEPVPGSDANPVEGTGTGVPHAWRAKLGSSVPASLSGVTNPLTNAPYQANDYVGSIIPQSFGQDFRPKLYSDAAATNEIPATDSSDWFLDPFAGVVVQEGYEDGVKFDFGTNGRLVCYVYIGQSVTDALAEVPTGSGGTGSIGEWQDSVAGFTNDLSSGTTQAALTVYPDIALSGGSMEMITNGFRVINVGGDISGLPIYDTTTEEVSTGTVPNNAIITWFTSDPAGTAGGVEGWIVYEATTGSFTSVDPDGIIARFTGSNWVQQTFEKTIPQDQVLTLEPTAGGIATWQIASNSTLSFVPSVNEFEMNVNNLRVDDISGSPGVAYGTITDGSAPAGLTNLGTGNVDGLADFEVTSGELQVGDVVKINGTFYTNVLTVVTGATDTITVQSVNLISTSITSVINATITDHTDFESAYAAATNTLSDVYFIWNSSNAEYALEIDDSSSVIYYIVEN